MAGRDPAALSAGPAVSRFAQASALCAVGCGNLTECPRDGTMDLLPARNPAL